MKLKAKHCKDSVQHLLSNPIPVIKLDMNARKMHKICRKYRGLEN